MIQQIELDLNQITMIPINKIRFHSKGWKSIKWFLLILINLISINDCVQTTGETFQFVPGKSRFSSAFFFLLLSFSSPSPSPLSFSPYFSHLYHFHPNLNYQSDYKLQSFSSKITIIISLCNLSLVFSFVFFHGEEKKNRKKRVGEGKNRKRESERVSSFRFLSIFPVSNSIAWQQGSPSFPSQIGTFYWIAYISYHNLLEKREEEASEKEEKVRRRGKERGWKVDGIDLYILIPFLCGKRVEERRKERNRGWRREDRTELSSVGYCSQWIWNMVAFKLIFFPSYLLLFLSVSHNLSLLYCYIFP